MSSALSPRDRIITQLCRRGAILLGSKPGNQTIRYLLPGSGEKVARVLAGGQVQMERSGILATAAEGDALRNLLLREYDEALAAEQAYAREAQS